MLFDSVINMTLIDDDKVVVAGRKPETWALLKLNLHDLHSNSYVKYTDFPICGTAQVTVGGFGHCIAVADG